MKLISIRALLSASVLSLPLTALADPPPTPQNVQGGYIGGANYVRLTWEVTPGADAYNIYVYDTSNQVWQAVETGFTNANVGLTNVVWRQYDYGLMPASYAVTATNAEGESAASPAVAVDNTFAGFGATFWLYFAEGMLSPTNAFVSFINRAFPDGGDGMLEIGTDETNLTVVAFDSFIASGHGWWVTNLEPLTTYYVAATTLDPVRESGYRYGWVDWSFFRTPDTNHPPVAESRDSDWSGVTEPLPGLLWLTFTDNEYNSGDLFTIRIVTQPTNGTVSLVTSQTYQLEAIVEYTPNPGARGEDHIEWVVNDGEVDSAPATLRIFNLHLNRLPAVQQMFTNTPEDMPLTVSVSAPDADGDLVTFECAGAGYGFAALDETGTNVTYTPLPEWSGQDLIYMWAYDGYGYTNFQIAVTVTPVNDPVTIVGYDFETYEDYPVNVWPQVYDGEGDTLTFRAVEGPSHGTVTGTVLPLVYTPDPNYFGPDSFQVVANDGNSDSAPTTFNVVVIPINDFPLAYPTNAVTVEDVSVPVHLTGFDVEGDPFTFLIENGPLHGILTGDGPDFVYTPEPNYNGEDTFEFRAVQDGTPGDPALVTITITPVNDPPQPGQPVSSSIVVSEDTSTNIVLTGTDPEGSSLTYEVVEGPSHGTLTGTAPNLVYTPQANYNGADGFTFRVFDGELYSTTAGEVPITVAPVNDAPQANANSISTTEDTSGNVVLTGSDIEGASLTFEVVAAPSHGTLTGTAPNLVYAPNANYNGGDAFTFRAFDGQSYSAAAQVTITVSAVNDAPVATPQSASTPYNTAVAITLAGSDVEGSSLTYTVLTQPASGSLTGTAPNLTFTPVIGFSGSVNFSFKVNDGALDSASASVSITVQAATAVPTAPSGLTATAVSRTQINLAWTDNSNNEDGFAVFRSTDNQHWTQIGTVGPNVTTYSSTGLSANKTYYYYVRAWNMLGNSPNSNTASAKTLK